MALRPPYPGEPGESQIAATPPPPWHARATDYLTGMSAFELAGCQEARFCLNDAGIHR